MTRLNYATIATVSLIALTLAPTAFAAVDNITAVDWTFTYAFGGNRWTACAQVNGRPAGLAAYTFQYGSYSKTGQLDLGGCFEVAQTLVGSNFGFGSAYTLAVGNSRPKTFKVSTARTLGGAIVAVSAFALLIPVLGLAGVAVAGTALAVALYTRRRNYRRANP